MAKVKKVEPKFDAKTGTEVTHTGNPADIVYGNNVVITKSADGQIVKTF